MRFSLDKLEEAKDMTSPDFATNTYKVRHEFEMTEHELAMLLVETEKSKINTNLFWAQLGNEKGFKWWTVARVRGSLTKFSAEVKDATS